MKSLGEDWQRFRYLLRQTPTRGFDEALQINMLLGGLRVQSKLMLDASVGGKISLKTPREAIEIIENMATNANEFKSESHGSIKETN